MERSQGKNNYTTLKSRGDIPSRKLLSTVGLCICADNKNTYRYPFQVTLLFLVAISVREINGFFTTCTCFLSSVQFYHSQVKFTLNI